MNRGNELPPPLPLPAVVLRDAGGPAVSRPASVTHIAVLGVVMALAGLAWGVTMFHMDGAENAVKGFYRTSALGSVPLDLFLLAGSIGILRRKEWAKHLMLVWAVLAGIYALVRFIVVILWIAPAATALSRTASAGKPPSEFGPEFAGMMMALVGGVAWVVTTILPMLAIVILRRRAKWGQRPRWP